MKKQVSRLLAAVCAAALLTGTACALTLDEAVALLETYYVDELPAAAYEAQTLDELFAAVGDPYTYYMDREGYEAFLGSVEGSRLVGIGVAINFTESGILISSVIPGGSAEELGLTAGDTIVAIDGVSCVPAQENDSTRIAGEEGTTVVLTILHADGSQQTYTATRRAFTVPTVTVGMLENGAGYIDCDSFASTTGTAFTEGVAEYGGETDLWVVDLRSNSGGLTNSAVAAAGVFTGQGFLLYLRDGTGAYYPYFSFNSDPAGDPAVVLTNQYSASASEIFASAIKDYGAGIVMGTRTYGKGVAQVVLDETNMPGLFDGDALKITAYRFYTGAANTTDSVGVLPTLLIPDAAVGDAVLMLHAAPPEDPAGWMQLTLAGWQFYLDVRAAQESEAGRAALAELFAALAPDVVAAVWMGDFWLSLDAPTAASYYEVEYESRWFQDLAASNYSKELNILATYGLLDGDGKGSFYPQSTLTRAELCALVCQTLDRVSLASSPFSDVADDSWYAPYVTKLYELGMVEGKGGGKFDPNGIVTQQEFVTVLGRLAGFLNTNCRDLLDRVDSQTVAETVPDSFPSWAAREAWLLDCGYAENILGSEGRMLYTSLEKITPDAPVLREQAGASLYRVLTVLGLLCY